MILLLTLAVAFMSMQSDPSLQPGVADTLARARAQQVSEVRYHLALTVPLERKAPLTGTQTIEFHLAAASAPVVVDFQPDRAGRLKGVRANGAEIAPRMAAGHVVVPAASLRAGDNRLEFTFDAGDTPLNRNDDFLYTIFVPARAHQAFPCFDQPDVKARWTLSLDVPAGWETLSNGAETSHDAADGRTRVSFAETQPISTYLFAFAAGKFSIERAERNGRVFRMFHRETDPAKVARNRDAIFDLHAAALTWLERYTGIPYPFGKFDFLLVPAFQFGGMEHPGAIFYNASGLMLEPSATQNELLGRASVISHETSHLWFGDLVTMKWFNDVWMKEVFANFMAAKIVNPSFPGINHELRFLLSYYPSAYEVDRTEGTNEIRQPLANLADAGTLYDAIIYQKAPIVMRQLETLMGEAAFRDGLREYLHDYAFGNASWTDLIERLDKRTPEDLATWSHAWVDERGRPIITTALETSGGKITALAFSQRDPVPARGLTWTQQLQVAIGSAGTIRTEPVKLEGTRVEVKDLAALPAVDFVLPNGGGIGYGEFHLDLASRMWLTAHLPEVPDALTRGAAWVSLWDAMLDGETSAQDLMTLALQSLPRESDELNVQRILGYASQDFWKFMTPAARAAVAPRLEAVLREGLTKAPSQSLKGAWFNALRDTATTPETVGWLRKVWAHEATVPGLVLAETDEIRLAEEIAVRDLDRAAPILDGEFQRIKNPDRQAQFSFVRPVFSPDAAARDGWFQALRDPANRRREPWVLEGLRYLHHPVHPDAARQYIRPALDMLAEIQRTGDIFFPKRWMDVTLGGHQSPADAALVRTFLAQAPADYPQRLRRIILSSADDLYRAARLATR